MPRIVRQPFQALTGCTSDWWGPREFRLTESRTFPGATHSYDLTSFKDPLALPQFVTLRHCSLVEGEGGQFINTKTGKPYDSSGPCIEKGVTMQYDEAATMSTREGVKASLVSVFGLKLLGGAGQGGMAERAPCAL